MQAYICYYGTVPPGTAARARRRCVSRPPSSLSDERSRRHPKSTVPCNTLVDVPYLNHTRCFSVTTKEAIDGRSSSTPALWLLITHGTRIRADMQAPWLPVLLALQASTTPVSAQGPPGTTTTQFAAMKGEVDLITARRSLAGVTCGDGDRIKIQSNAALLAFAARGCTVYNGTLYLRGAADITSLEALSGLTTILNGQLYIRGLASLTSLHGLRNLRGGLADSLIIRANVMLTNLEGLEGISAIGSSGKCDEGLCMYTLALNISTSALTLTLTFTLTLTLILTLTLTRTPSHSHS